MDLTGVMAALGSLVLERTPEGRFLRRGECPSWCTVLGAAPLTADVPFVVEDVFPFLDIFLPDAERLWGAELPGTISSDFWTEVGGGDEEVHLEATALRVGSRNLLVLTRNERLFAQKQLVLQRARELRLTHRDLTREVELKDILVHSIVHDLAAPLHGILGSLSLLSELPLGDQAARWTELALQAARRQKALVSDILDVFSSEHGVLTASPDPSESPDLAHAIRQVVAEVQAAARLNQTTITAELEPGPLRVVGEETRLVRVLGNLVENALRHSPTGGRITLSTEREEHSIRVNVDDEGPGVPKEVLPHLFELFAGGNPGRVGTGLGLYFCRITVERWGGGIGYEERAEGGARFWIRLVDALRRRHHG